MELSPVTTTSGGPSPVPTATGKPQGHIRSPSGTSTHSSNVGLGTSNGGAASRSLSMNSVSSEGSNESNLVEQEEIVALTHDVRGFKDALSKLRRIFHPEREKHEILRVAAHERLGEVLRILRAILDKYPPLQSTELLMAAGQLIQQVKGYNYENGKCNQTDFFTTIDQLALAFSSRVSEYLMGDIDTSSSLHPATKIRSCENLIHTSGDADNYVSAPKENREPDSLSSEEIDGILMKFDNGVNVALHRAKVWSKYAKDIITYIEKRANLEVEYARSLSKLAQNTRQALKEESCLPLQSIYCTALDQDVSNANDGLAMCTALQEYKFVEPLTARRSEHERQRKQIKEIWQREVKKMQEALTNLRKAKSQYIQRNQDYEKAKDVLIKTENTEGIDGNKIDKKKKLEEDAAQKVLEAESNYKECVETANCRHQGLESTKFDILRQVRELMLQCDTTMKAVTVTYFQLQHTFSAPAPVKFQTLCESSRLYEPGAQYLEFIKRYSNSLNAVHVEHNPNPYAFERYSPDGRNCEKERKSIDSCEMADEGNSTNRAENKDRARTSQSVKVWNPAVTAVMGSDSDSIGSSQSNKSRDTSPSASPQVPSRRLVSHASSGDELDVETEILESGYQCNRKPLGSKAASTHALRKLKTMGKCRECDTYVYFQGVECTRCGLACHKKCLEALAIQCGHKKLPRKMTTFGVDLQTHSQETRVPVPHLVTKCVSEIDRRGSEIKGIYRVSGVKSRIEKLCQSFENGANLVDLSDVHPNVIANVLKLYLRQLPEPLLTFPHYPDFIRIAKDYQTRTGDDNEAATLQELKEVISKLKPAYYSTLCTLIHHLRRVASLSSINNMPPSNLGIVFGPTLLRTIEGGASLTSLVDTVHQAKVVELLIEHAMEIFPDKPDFTQPDKDFGVVGKSPQSLNPKSDGESKGVGHDAAPAGAISSDVNGQVGLLKGTAMHLPLREPTGDEILKGSPGFGDDRSPSLTDKGDWAGILPSDDESFDSLPSEVQNAKQSCHNIPVKLVHDSKLQHDEVDAALKQTHPGRLRVPHPDFPAELIGSQQNRSSSFSTLDKPKLPLTSASSMRIEKSKILVAVSEVATQTEASFLRNLASSPVPTGNKGQGISAKGTSSGSAPEKIVIHVAGPKDGLGIGGKAKTQSRETQSTDLPSVVKTTAKIAPKLETKDAGGKNDSVEDCGTNCSVNRLKSASSQVSLIDLDGLDKSLENEATSVANQINDKKHDLEGNRLQDKRSYLSLPPSQADQDSGFEDTRPSPDGSPSHYVSPYLTDDPYKKYRLGTGSALQFSKTTTFANYDLSHRRTPVPSLSNHDKLVPAPQVPGKSTLEAFKQTTQGAPSNGIANSTTPKAKEDSLECSETANEKTAADVSNGKMDELVRGEDWREREPHFV